MKKDRNCGNGTPYPIYNQYPGMINPMMPGIPNNIMTPIPYMNPMMTGPMNMPNITNGNTINYETEINNINNRLNSLERRINNIENTINDTKMTTYANKYSSSNYQIM